LNLARRDVGEHDRVDERRALDRAPGEVGPGQGLGSTGAIVCHGGYSDPSVPLATCQSASRSMRRHRLRFGREELDIVDTEWTWRVGVTL
jgi:hypothetical protein